TEKEALGKSIEIVVPPAERGTDRGEVVHSKGISTHFEADRLKKDGSFIPVSITISPVKNDKGKVIATSAVHKDLSEQKKADEALRQSEKRFRNLVEFAGDAIFVNDFDGNIIDVNQRACDSLGYTREELLKLNIRDIELTFDSSQHTEKWKQIVHGEPITIEGMHERKDRTTFPIEVRLGKFELNGQELIVGLARDMTEHKQAEEKLLFAMGKAEAANEAKTEFLSNMSHELRSPLNSVIGFSEILLRDSKDELVGQLAPKIRESGKYLTRLIEDLLDFERIEAGKVKLNLEETSIANLVNEAVVSLESRLPEGFTVELDLSSFDEVVLCDPTRIRQVLTNMLDNAVKYSPDGGTIRVRTLMHPEEVRVSVQDHGLGMDQEEMESIFDRFHQLESGYKRRAGGLGIGLSLIRQLLELHGGHIWVESEKNKGSTFTFSLPKIPARAPEGSAQSGGQPGSGGENQAEPWAGQTILVVDDVDHYHEYMKLLMESAGRVLSAYNGEEGIKMALREKPDIILMDLRMPVLDGFDAISRLKENPETKDIPIVALSAQSMEEDKIASTQIGAEGFTAKPIDIKELQKEMKRVTSLKKKVTKG
ncbi:MAG: PAS domain S-box protein, partial [bacterium]